MSAKRQQLPQCSCPGGQWGCIERSTSCPSGLHAGGRGAAGKGAAAPGKGRVLVRAQCHRRCVAMPTWPAAYTTSALRQRLPRRKPRCGPPRTFPAHYRQAISYADAWSTYRRFAAAHHATPVTALATAAAHRSPTVASLFFNRSCSRIRVRNAWSIQWLLSKRPCSFATH